MFSKFGQRAPRELRPRNHRAEQFTRHDNPPLPAVPSPRQPPGRVHTPARRSLRTLLWSPGTLETAGRGPRGTGISKRKERQSLPLRGAAPGSSHQSKVVPAPSQGEPESPSGWTRAVGWPREGGGSRGLYPSPSAMRSKPPPLSRPHNRCPSANAAVQIDAEVSHLGPPGAPRAFLQASATPRVEVAGAVKGRGPSRCLELRLPRGAAGVAPAGPECRSAGIDVSFFTEFSNVSLSFKKCDECRMKMGHDPEHLRCSRLFAKPAESVISPR